MKTIGNGFSIKSFSTEEKVLIQILMEEIKPVVAQKKGLIIGIFPMREHFSEVSNFTENNANHHFFDGVLSYKYEACDCDIDELIEPCFFERKE